MFTRGGIRDTSNVPTNFMLQSMCNRSPRIFRKFNPHDFWNMFEIPLDSIDLQTTNGAIIQITVRPRNELKFMFRQTNPVLISSFIRAKVTKMILINFDDKKGCAILVYQRECSKLVIDKQTSICSYDNLQIIQNFWNTWLYTFCLNCSKLWSQDFFQRFNLLFL